MRLLALTLLFVACFGTVVSFFCPWKCHCDHQKHFVNCSRLNFTYLDLPRIAPDTRILELNYNNITYLRLNNLRHPGQVLELYLEHNSMRNIHFKAFAGFHKLKLLSLQGNHVTLKKVPFKYLTQLQRLKLSSNGISNLASEFTYLNELVMLDLHKNDLMTLNEKVFDGLSNLKTLHLHQNKLRFIHPLVFKFTPLLQSLYMQHNSLATIEPSTFKYSEFLIKLNLGYNMLRKLDALMFAGLDNLQILYLYGNHIEEIDPDTFEVTPNLKEILLQRNRLKAISYLTFSHLKHLVFLSLIRNSLETIPTDAFRGAVSLKKLLLEKNMFICDCNLHDFVQFLSAKRTVIQVTGGCTNKTNHHIQFNSIKENALSCSHPHIMEGPEDLTVESGDDAKFKCKVEGTPKPVVFWLQNDNDVTELDKTHYEVMNDGTLMIHDAKDDDKGRYMCVAKSEMGEVRSGANLSINQQYSGPIFKVHPRNEAVSIGRPFFRFDCVAEGIPKPHITWFLNNERILRSERVSILHNSSIIIKDIRPADLGIYTCRAKNIIDEINYSAELTVLEPPKFVLLPKDQLSKEGDLVTFKCAASGTPDPQISWYKNSKLLENVGKISLTNNNEVMTISNVSNEDNGDYTCEAMNSEGAVEINTNLKVEKLEVLEYPDTTPPKIVIKPENTDAFTKTTVQLACEIISGVPVLVEWTKDGSFLQDVHRISISAVGNLIIKNVSKADSGSYDCIASSEYGTDTASAILTVNEYLLPDDEYVNLAITMAAKDIDNAINKTIEQMFNHDSRVINVHDLFRITRFPNAPAREMARAAEIYERTLDVIKNYTNSGHNTSADPYNYHNILSNEHLEIISRLSGCTAHREEKNCSDVCFHSKYRSFDGTCNNLGYPTWGASFTGFRRVLRPIYENGFSQPVGWNKDKKYNGFTLPSARKVSTSIISTNEITADSGITHMVMQWGQWLDHDIDHSLPSVSSQTWDGVDCKKTCDYAAPCFPIDVPQNDTRIHNRRCIDFIRTSSVCGSGMTSALFGNLQQREQLNQLTSYIDASQVYGFDEIVANDLRDLTNENGLLRVGISLSGSKPLLPTTGVNAMDCRLNLQESTRPCFVSGDIRANEQIGLAAMHTIWMREHNRVALSLKELNPSWNGDKVYQEARKIIGAEMQVITYQHWLPIILGPEGYSNLGEYEGYNSNIHPSVSNVFATAALRFGHTIINPILNRFNENFEDIPQGPLMLRHAFFSPWRIVDEGGIDPLIRGMFATAAKLKTPTQNLNSELTEKLFYSAHAVALDLAAINIQRGRDHALPSYTEWRKFCNMSIVNSFDELEDDISDRGVREKLKELYGSVHNIDVWVGGILEDTVLEGKVGPLIRCLLIEQFRRSRDGDRFWYENPNTFKPEQLKEIKKTNLARVLCDNGDTIDTIQENVFLLRKVPEDFVSCEEIPSMDLSAWLDCDSGCSLGTNGTQNWQCKSHERTKYLEETNRIIQQLRKKNEYLEEKLFSLTGERE